MSDLAAPILYIMQDEALAFWCFSALMERMEANFSTDSTSMQVQNSASFHPHLMPLVMQIFTGIVKPAYSTSVGEVSPASPQQSAVDSKFSEPEWDPLATANLAILPCIIWGSWITRGGGTGDQILVRF
jgi:hypothetical protein